ncbi:serine hydrolase domain-containing protein [Thalassovita mangrovi]|uniref:Serine hydrolase n=1 Tax=Thalassovita mangrovi TaxID=2692236 RepID=A0A6L8LDX8_9RHOB|nr:serine hydrolase domain-containing protein [Thalassovita mangrovi]MYM54271.1 serine hydrolase [Thalassovita mangrovi]
MKRLLLAIALSLGLAATLSQPSRAQQSDPPAAVEALLETFRDAYGFPGATAAYALPDGTIGTVAVGFANVEAGIAMTPRSRMLAASIGKTLWGALVLSLETEGALRRSDLVSDYLGGFSWFARIPNAETMTIGQLLTHSAGLPDHVHMDGVVQALIELGTAQPFEPSDVLSFVLDQPPLFEAGSGWAYSDTGYILLGLVIEAASGRDVFDLARERFLQPLGLTDTVPSRSPVIEGLAVGYTLDDNPFGLAARTMDESGSLTWTPAVEWTGGGFASTSANLAMWGHALFTGAAMDADYLERLLDAVPVDPDAPGVLYGSGVAIYEDTPLGPVYGHGGWIPGYVSSLRHYADRGLTIAFQINTDVGVVDDGTDLVPALEAALAKLLFDSGSN